jgi:HSP20 family molecular chaperone IbpA
MYLEQDERTNRHEVDYLAYKVDDAIKVELKVPGYTAEDIELKATKKIVQIFGNPTSAVAKGRWTNGFYVGFPITDEQKLDTTGKNVTVNLTNGILTITIPVAEEHRAVTLEVTEGIQE